MPNNTCPPLLAVQNIGRKYPGIWDLMDHFANAKEGELPYWDKNLCYLPIAAGISAVEQYSDRTTAVGMGELVSCLASWRREKLIYRFDETLASEIMADADADMKIPMEILFSMPSKCFYIQFDDTGMELDGFFVFMEYDVNTGEKELRLDYLDRKGNNAVKYIIHLIPNGTVEDGIQAAIDTVNNNPVSDIAKSLWKQYAEKTKHLTAQAVSLVLYVCAENAEITENQEQKVIYRKSDRIVDKYRELIKWDVGVKTGEVLRKIKRREEEEKNSYGEREYNLIHKNRPHVRRAHWHHFWTGSGDNRKLILRWINSMIINADDGDTSPTVIPIEKEQ